jgi:hypothetical protein
MRTVAQATVLAVVLMAGVARAGAPGSLFITAEQVDTSAGDFEHTLKKQATQTLESKNDQWTLYFVAFLKHAPGAPEVQLVFYDTAVKAHEPTNAFPIATQSSAKVLASSVSFGADQGFKPGHKYNVLITRLVHGKEDIYAHSTLTLK